MGFGWSETGRSQHLPLAVNAQGNSRINLQTLQGDMLTTGKTIAKLIIIKTTQRRRQHRDSRLAPLFTCQIH